MRTRGGFQLFNIFLFLQVAPNPGPHECCLPSLPRTSVRLDRRHYNAWYGIGLTYYKQERFQLAEIYYRKALAINPFSPVLMCHVAVVQHATNNSGAALDTLNGAIKISPK